MSGQVFEQHVDEHGNVSVRVSQDVVVLTREDADLLKARFDQINAENAKLRDEMSQLRAQLDEDEHELSMAADRETHATRRETKLRELVRDVGKAAHMLCEAWEGSCSREYEGMSLHAACPIGDTSELCVFTLDKRMCELGVEVP